jgi:hypothetical protein
LHNKDFRKAKQHVFLIYGRIFGYAENGLSGAMEPEFALAPVSSFGRYAATVGQGVEVIRGSPANRASVGGCPRPAQGLRRIGSVAHLALFSTHTRRFLAKSFDLVARSGHRNHHSWRDPPNLWLQTDPSGAPHP